MYLPTEQETLSSYFQRARSCVVESPYCNEIEWQRSRCISKITESEFLQETAWVILNSGFRERTVRTIFPNISLAFFDWTSASLIAKKRQSCVEIAGYIFKHSKKVNAIANAAVYVHENGISAVHEGLKENPIDFLSSFDFVGQVTAWHLAKNLGCDVAKPDRHLVRIASHFGYECVHSLCRDVSKEFDEKTSVVDLIFWRFAASSGELSETNYSACAQS